MGTKHFFDETTEQSRIKSEIVAKYFWAWAKVVIPTAKKQSNRIAYIDLFAGPGRYKDGTKSTPLLVLERAISDPDMSKMLVTMFNDKNSDHSKSLEQAINSLPNIENLSYKPKVFNNEVGSELVKMFDGMSFVPTLFFVDPWGYKGLSLQLINSVLKHWGCDCIFFFNYRRINMGVSNPIFLSHMDALFGNGNTESLHHRLRGLSAKERELGVVEELATALKSMGGHYVLPFCFKNENGKRTSHYLIYISKAFKGYEIMKNIMAKESSEEEQGVPSFSYCPATEKQLFLFKFSRPLDDLKGMLLEDFSGQTLSMHDIYKQHSVDKPYISKNYKEVLKQLEAGNHIMANPPATKRRKDTFSDKVIVSFP